MTVSVTTEVEVVLDETTYRLSLRNGEAVALTKHAPGEQRWDLDWSDLPECAQDLIETQLDANRVPQ